MDPFVAEAATPLLHSTSSDTSSDADDNTPAPSYTFDLKQIGFRCDFLSKSPSGYCPYRQLAVLSGHIGSVSCLAMCGEFILSASQGKDIIVWQQPDLRVFTRFGHGEGSVKAVVTVGSKVFTAHQDGKIRVWKVSRRSENNFRLVNTLPTAKDYLDGKIKAWGRKKQEEEQEQEQEETHCLLGILEGHKDESMNCVVVSGDGKWVYGGISDGFLMGWEKTGESVSCWKVVWERRAHKMAVLCVCLMGEFLCSGSADKSIGIWRREAFGRLCKVGVINGHDGPIKCLQVAPNGVGEGFLLYSGSLDRSLRVWWVSKASAMGVGALVAEDSKKAVVSF
ncbi:protein JINGUBANG isoform X3 [Cucurbita pepo subsp. pepo]|uniref:protein JINGUBANG isoform X3 n=1 Tax=Cucurbita pepo subsp. pepo TaxID=3664 RepID=UPI000C9D3084|nr:protein JINGUBANG isoform X3 [Cucurbita pepo subsp. pepo]